MRQVVIPRYGPPGVLTLREGEDPVPGPGEIRIRVQAAGVNFADVLARMGLYPDAPKPPCGLGYEVAGVADACGPGVAAVAEGDQVIALTRFAGYADVAVVPARFVFKRPAHLSAAEGAGIPVNYLTAALALYKLANVGAGETVLLHGAGGGVGIAATQLARLRRATIIGVASEAKHVALRSFGVDHTIDRRADVPAEVRRITKGRGADVVLDPIGGESLRASYRMLAPLGRLVIYGVSSAAPGARRSWWRVFRVMQRTPRFHPMSLMNRNRGVFGLNLGHLWTEEAQLAGIMQTLLGEFSTGRLRAVIAKTFPLERAADAHEFLQARQNIGKVVLTT